MITAEDPALRCALERGLLRPERAGDAPVGARGREMLEWLTAEAGVDAAELARALAEAFRVEYVDLRQASPVIAALTALPREVAARHAACPLDLADGRLRVAVADPADTDAVDALAHASGHPVDCVVASLPEIRRTLARLPDWSDPGLTVVADAPAAASEEVTPDDAPVIRLVHGIVADAVRRRASDIHLEPLEHRFRVRYRIDGVLQETAAPPKRLQAAIVSRVKIMAHLSIAERRVPQDGRIRLRLGERELDLRVATMPTAHGESVVLRVLDRATIAPGLAELGLWADDVARLERAIAAPDGLVLVTGPTGSGKTTTLYAALQRLNDRGRKLITVEDPVEYQIAGLNQVAVNPAAGLNFAGAIRAMLRQSPNVIMVGEIRDGETAENALNASLTGHLVLSSLHTNDAPGALARLRDIGVKPFLVAASLRLVLAQRLVRRICEGCRTRHVPSPAQRELLGIDAATAAQATFARGTGCAACGGTGFRGRLGIFELLEMDAALRALIYERVTAARVREVARRGGLHTMRADGVRKVLAGLTTIEEVAAVSVEEAVRPPDRISLP